MRSGNSLSPLLPEFKRGRGYPRTDKRKTLNSIIFILLNGSRWCDLPVGEQWGKRSTSHRWLKLWGQDGTLELLWRGMLNEAEFEGLIDWSTACVDGSFSLWKGR